MKLALQKKLRNKTKRMINNEKKIKKKYKKK